MLLVTQTHVLDKRFGMKKTIELLAEAGFDGIDLSMFEMTYNPDSALKPPTDSIFLKIIKKSQNHAISLSDRHTRRFLSKTELTKDGRKRTFPP